MLIAVAGTIGAGKSTVAEGIATRLAIPLHSIDDDKRAIGAVTPGFATWVAEGTPFPDDFRIAAFERTLAGLAAAGPGSHVVVEETFHRKAIRDPFFDRGAALLGGFVLVEVVAAESTILQRLATRARRDTDHLAGVAMHEAFAAVTDPQDRVDFTFRNEAAHDAAGFEAELDRCEAYLRRRLGLRDPSGSDVT